MVKDYSELLEFLDQGLDGDYTESDIELLAEIEGVNIEYDY
jgi:hypothetical protein